LRCHWLTSQRRHTKACLEHLRRDQALRMPGSISLQAAIGSIGKDSLGRIVVEELSGWAQNLWIHEDETSPTSATLVLVHPDGERTFISAVGANASLKQEHLPWDEMIEAGARAVHLGYALLLPGLDGAPMMRVLEKARELGLLVSLDVTWLPAASWEDALAPLPCVDVFCPNLTEAEAITREADPARAADALLDAGVKEVGAITLGEKGCYVGVVGSEHRFLSGFQEHSS
jgi:sugar/nucleoside kinase (ribokinase family)